MNSSRIRIPFSYMMGLMMTAVVCVCLAPSRLSACTVPVFRYALERWQSDLYVVEIQHHGKLNRDDQAIVDFLRKHQRAEKDDSGHTNLNVRLTEIERAPSETSNRPTMILRFPLKTRKTEAIWQGDLTAANAAKLVNSPVRKKIAKRILGGDSAVWILLESGNKTKDQKAADLLRKELKAAQIEFKLPELAVEDATREAPENLPDVRLAFSMVSLSRKDPEESILIASLLRTESDLLTFTDEPIVFPVFGQGRALYALIGKGIAKDNIHEACGFLTGACSCIEKVGNPGVDLLMTAVWWSPEMTSAIKEIELPELTGIAFANPVDVPTVPKATITPTESEGSTVLIWSVVCCLVGLAAFVLIYSTVTSKRNGE
jgi:hypothetical protein